MSGQMPWGAVAFMMAVYTFLGACFMGGVIDVDPSSQLIPIADTGFGSGILGYIAGVTNFVWNIVTFNIPGLPDMARVPIVGITGMMLLWIALQFVHKIKSIVNPLGG